MSASTPLSIERRPHEEFALFRLTGGFTAAALPPLAREIDQAEQDGARGIALDMEGVGHIDSRAVGALLGWHRHFTIRDQRFQLLNVGEDVLHVLRLCNLCGLLDIGPTERDPHVEIRRKREALLQSYDYVQQIVAAIGEGVLAVGTSGEILFANPAAERLLQTEEADLLGETFLSLIEGLCSEGKVPSDWAAEFEGVCKGERRGSSGEIALRASDGQPHRVRLLAASIRGDQGPDGAVVGLEDVTSREQAKIQTEYLSHAIQCIAEMVIITDLEGTIVYVNDALIDAYGYRREELIGEQVDVVHSARNPPELAQRILEQTLAGGFQGELHNRRHDGSDFPISLSTSVIRDESGEPFALIGVATDITERRGAEEVQARSEMTYRSAIEAAQGVPYRLNFSTRQYEFMGTGLKDLTGLESGDVDFDRFQSIVEEMVFTDPSIPTDAKARYEAFLGGELARFHADVRIRTADGEERWLSDSCIPLRDEATGEVMGALGILQDVTHRRRTEQALRESERLFNRALEQGDAVVYHRNMVEERYEFIGENIERLVGHRAEDITVDLWKNLMIRMELHGEHRHANLEECQRKFRDGEITDWRADVLIRMGEGQTRWLRDISTGILDDSGRVIGSLGILMDVDEFKRTEEALRTSSRLEATATLAGGIAHDFNNLMVGVLGSAALLGVDLGTDHPSRWLIDQIENAAEKAGHLAQQMLAYARGGKYQPQPLSLNRMVEEALSLQAHTFPPTVALERALEPDLKTVSADATQMTQVVMNLCLNAIEAIEDSGTVRVQTENITLSAEDLERIDGLSAAECVALTVTDDGCGMDRETLERLFEPFFTTKFQGRGLGMAAVYGIVQNHGGHIDVNSAPGRGTTVRVMLPMSGEDAPEVEEREVKVPRGDETILVIDDEEIVLRVTTALLRRLGYEVLTAASGEEAIEIARTHSGEIHLALLDMWMPRMGGSEIFPLLREARPEIRVLVCSGFELDKAAQALIDRGADGFLSKPFKFDEIAPRLREILDA